MAALEGTLNAVLIQFPVVLVWLVGVILSLLHWRRHPQVARLTLVAIVILFVEFFMSTYLNLWLPIRLRSAGWNAGQLGLFYPLAGTVEALIRAIAWGLLIAAIFRGRNDSWRH